MGPVLIFGLLGLVIGILVFLKLARGTNLRVSKMHLQECSESEVPVLEQRQASRTFSFTSFGIERKPPGAKPQKGGFWKYIGWSAWGIRQYPKTTRLGGKCDQALTVGTKVYLTELDDEWTILEIFCLENYNDLPIAILFQNSADPASFILSFSGFKFPVCWPFPGVRTGLPLTLLRLAWDNFTRVRSVRSVDLIEAPGARVNSMALHYLRSLESSSSLTQRVSDLIAATAPRDAPTVALHITGHSLGGSMAQVYSLVARKSPLLRHARIKCSAHGPMRTGNAIFYESLASESVQVQVFFYTAPSSVETIEIPIDEIPFAPTLSPDYVDPPNKFVLLTLTTKASGGNPTKKEFKLFKFRPGAPLMNALSTALTARIPSFPSNHVAGLYEDFFVRIHEQEKTHKSN